MSFSESAILDCNSKSVTISKLGIDPLVSEFDYISTPIHIISLLCAKRLVSKACLDFSEHLRDDTSKKPLIESVPTVCEFVDVFSTHMCGMPLERDIDS